MRLADGFYLYNHSNGLEASVRIDDHQHELFQLKLHLAPLMPFMACLPRLTMSHLCLHILETSEAPPSNRISAPLQYALSNISIIIIITPNP